MKNSRKKGKKLRVLRILSLVLMVCGIVGLAKNLPSKNQQIFQANINTLSTTEVADLDIENIVITQNVPIPDEIKAKLEEEQKAKEEAERIAEEEAEQERLAQEQAEAEAKAKQEEELRLAQTKTQVTSRGGVVRSSSKTEYQTYAKDLCLNTYGWSENDYECLVNLWEKESNWNPNVKNSSSSASGIPQFLSSTVNSYSDSSYYSDWQEQIRAGLKYIKSRYGNPSSAWSFWQNHNWY
jgi:hypothetical protein